MAAPKGLHALARLHGVQTAYRANDGSRVTASPEALLAALRALRVPARSASDLPDLLAHRRRQLADRTLEPVVVGWRDSAGRTVGHIRLRLPRRLTDATLRITVEHEEGGERSWLVPASSLEPLETVEAEGRAWAVVRASLPDLPEGYHELTVEVGAARWEALLMVAPRRAAGWNVISDRRAWGVFAPLYALWEEGGSAPDFDLLDRLAQRVAAHGGSVVGTLPVLAAFLDRPVEASPYAPASRLFWNEMYTDPLDAPGAEALSDDDRATLLRDLAAAAGPAAGGGLMDPGGLMAAKRPALEALARRFFEGDPEAELAAFRARNPLADDYARFRAVTERRGMWPGWPERLRARDVRPGDADEEIVRYHLYVQWLAERQLAAATERAADRGVSLYLDLPVGVHPGGYDIWRERPLFARGASAGAPPDPLAPQGQDWGFPPLHPEAIRLDRHRYFVACIRNHLRFAKVLRIDHVMQLHRLFWVPAGDSADGVYVRYPAEELYAVLCLESRRAGAVIVGEDLGTVPAAVRREMKRHGLHGMHVAQFSMRQGPGGLVPGPVPRGTVASIGTHDTPTFAGWNNNNNNNNNRTTEQQNNGTTATAELPGAGTHAHAHGGTAVGTGLGMLRELHGHMGRSEGGLVLATMEDLWLEREPQNVPGTTGERNWRRRSARPLDALDGGEPAALLDELDQARREAE